MRHPEYSDTLLDHFRAPRGVGQVEGPDAEALVVSPIHGDNLRLTFAIREHRLSEVRFQCSGCVVAIASGSIATTLLQGRTVAEALALTDDAVVRALGGVPEGRRVCSVMVSRAVRLALAEP
jgi:nitrogen fixation NifU-like protein